ncbi:RNA polymerase sigma factor [Pseudobacter ginsenosidimutans]|uniref:RNA polymerase sigma-70 factor (ECF subfamily) n=1 Tax=Pseudobacter ginsenosidimutans TaxID=661488 RepID=A0A4V2EZP4_9BACT|nr:sigma-70 family RNA polymerase sigma factor [Pseudobacter ginsenosidimutans]QEC45652.1 sigma-70 family RNA polymerase sigma factor [Pseudobacter ginsenosidimutans]RZS67200.1 RNA polymerase sigma-70 factor (ECF subfamily) [Pseudobacter ginsenosidimutans]
MNNYQTYTDQQLLDSLKLNEEKAFTAIYNRYWEQLYRSAYRKLTDKAAAKEIVHDVLIDIWKRRESLSVNHLPAYLEKAIRFRVINYINRNKSSHFLDVFQTILYSPFEADSQVNMQEFLKLLDAWIAALPEKRRQIFVKYYFENLSAREIASELDISAKTVQNNLSITTQQLKAWLTQLMVIMMVVSGSSHFKA